MTSDQRTRAAERKGDRVAWLVERLRAGTLTHEALELAAYCGDSAARALVGKDLAFVDQIDLATFVKGLRSLTDPDKWDGAIERAALAACEVWRGVYRGECEGHPARKPVAFCSAGPGCTQNLRREYGTRAIEAARAHIEAPSDESRRALRPHMASALHPTPVSLLALHAWNIGHGVHAEQWRRLIARCAQLSDPAAVRAGICAALIAWSLG